MSGTTTIRLTEEDNARLDALAPKFGGRSAVFRAGLALLAAEQERSEAYDAFLAEWERDVGRPDPVEISAMIDTYNL